MIDRFVDDGVRRDDVNNITDDTQNKDFFRHLRAG